MATLKLPSSWGLQAGALFAVVFGLLTIVSGGQVLVSTQAQQAAGAYVGFVVWFNTLAGFCYVIAGVGLWQRQLWAVKVAWGIALATLLVFGLFGGHVISGGAYELRTVLAMLFRLGVWSGLAWIAQTSLTQTDKI